MKTIERMQNSKSWRIAFAIILVLGLCLPSTLLNTQPAHAADTATIHYGNKIGYAGYSTQSMYTSQNAPVICAQPDKATPEPGTYTKLPLDTYLKNKDQWYDSRISDIKKIFYYGVGGPGFDPSIWPSTYYDGSPMDYEKYYVAMHILISDLYSLDGPRACHGTSQAFKEWAVKEVIGVDNGWIEEGYHEYHDASRYKINRAPSANLDVYALAGEDGAQCVLTFDPSGWIDLDKDSGNTAITNGNDCYSLQGAEYTIYSNAACTNAVGKLTTNADGYAKSGEMSPGTYYVKETKQAKGYALDNTVYTVRVNGGQTARVNGSKVYDQPQNDPIGILLGKHDGEKTYNGEKNLPTGAASLAGAEFTVKYYDGYYDTAEDAEKSGNPTRSWVIKTDSDGFSILDPEYLVKGDPFYTNSVGDLTLPLGTIVIQETKAPTGYNLNNTMFVRQITTAGTSESIFTYNTPQVPDQIKRGDICFVKKGENAQNRLANVPFKITSKTTGESHILVTDENGYASTAANYNPHTQSTNVNDNKSDGSYNNQAGIWFGGTTPNNSVGALPYDTYTIEELPCKANKGLQLIKDKEIVVTRHNFMIDLGTMDDPSAYISTQAWDALDGDKYVVADEKAHITDTITYTDLVEGRNYVMQGKLVHGDKVIAEAQTTFTADKANGKVDVTFEVDLTQLADETLWVSEELLSDGRVIADHNDPDDPEQQVEVIETEIGTKATDTLDGNQVAINDDEAQITDTVTITNAIPGVEYKLTGQLMVKKFDENGEVAAADPLYVLPDGTLTQDAFLGGTPLTAETTFTATATNEEQQVVFDFNSYGLEEMDLVVYETLIKTETERVVATHEDPNDGGQSIKTLNTYIGTTAADGLDGDKLVISDSEAKVTDTVALHNAIPGMEYRLDGQIMIPVMDDEGNITDAKPLLVTDAGVVTEDEEEGHPVTATKTFIAENTDESHELTFDLNCAQAGATNLVVYEYLTKIKTDKQIASHEDPTDEGQSFATTPALISTNASDASDGDKVVAPDEEVTIVDTINYQNFIQDHKGYTFGGIVVDKSTGLPVLVGEGADEIDEQELKQFVFEMQRALGFDPVDDPGYDMEIPTAENAVEEDTDKSEEQVAQEKEFMDAVNAFVKELEESSDEAPEYTPLSIINNVDVEAVKKVIEDHSDLYKLLVTNLTSFEPLRDHGTAEMKFEIDTSGMENSTELVVYEIGFKTAEDGTINVVTAEMDPNNTDQTVTVQAPEIGTELTDASDGDHTLLNSADGKLIDTVAYKGLIADGSTEYIMSGKLMNKATGKELLINDKPVTGEVRFTPNTPDGTVDVEFNLDASTLDGLDLVAFEVCTKAVGDGDRTVATHEDINDGGQTVKVVTPEYGTAYDKTGQDLGWLIGVIALLAAGAVAGIGYTMYRRSKENGEDNTETINK